MHLQDKIIVVLGGKGLLGSAIVNECQKDGARVVIGDIQDGVDVTNEERLSAFAQEVKKEYGRIDGVINATYAAATRASDNGKFMESNIDAMLESASLHLRTCFNTVRAFAPVFTEQGQGSIVFIASIYGVVAPRFEIYDGLPMTQPAEYAAAKGGIIAVTRYFASLLGTDGVRVNTISPGGIAANQPQSFVDGYSKKLLLGKGLLAPEHISGVAAFLLSDASAMMTGQNLVVDGGWTV